MENVIFQTLGSTAISILRPHDLAGFQTGTKTQVIEVWVQNWAPKWTYKFWFELWTHVVFSWKPQQNCGLYSSPESLPSQTTPT